MTLAVDRNAFTDENFTFQGHADVALQGRLVRPTGPVRGAAIFAHCFTCSMQSLAARRVSESLAAHGFITLRFDFTGLGGSEGDFTNTDFASNIEDLLLAAEAMSAAGHAPSLLVGHSLGGAAVLHAAAGLPDVKFVATIGAPCDPAHVRHLLEGHVDDIQRTGRAEVQLAGRPFCITASFLEDLTRHDVAARLASLDADILLLHAPQDETVSFKNAEWIRDARPGRTSIVPLPADANHLLTDAGHAAFVAHIISSFAETYESGARDAVGAAAGPARVDGAVVVAENAQTPYGQDIQAGRHRLVADEPIKVGGQDSGAGPYDLLLAGLGACTSMTLRMYADRKKWPLEHVAVTLTHTKVHADQCATCETKTGKIDRIDRTIDIKGDLDDEQRARLLEIADKCPVHKTLHSENEIRTFLKRP